MTYTVVYVFFFFLFLRRFDAGVFVMNCGRAHTVDDEAVGALCVVALLRKRKMCNLHFHQLLIRLIRVLFD